MPANDLTIQDAKDIAYKRRLAGGAVVVGFSGDVFAVVSYGMTRKKCGALRAVTDRIADLIADGTIEIPPELYEGTP